MDLRLATPADAPGVQAIYAPIVRDTAISFQETPPTVGEIAERINQTMTRFPWLVAEDAGEIAGYAYASPHRGRAAYRWSVEVSIYVHARCRRRGLGRALYGTLLPVLAAQGFVTAWAGVTLPNDASEALHRTVGFEEVGTYERVGFKHGVWRDTRWYRYALRPPPDTPTEPIPLPTFTETEAWPRLLDTGRRFLR
ncbi:MAG: arsinothricin resistance N-acetyltransferase ArsN1 family B [Bacteroidota bacterium]